MNRDLLQSHLTAPPELPMRVLQWRRRECGFRWIRFWRWLILTGHESPLNVIANAFRAGFLSASHLGGGSDGDLTEKGIAADYQG